MPEAREPVLKIGALADPNEGPDPKSMGRRRAVAAADESEGAAPIRGGERPIAERRALVQLLGLATNPGGVRRLLSMCAAAAQTTRRRVCFRLGVCAATAGTAPCASKR
jgi:hypothetical protein